MTHEMWIGGLRLTWWGGGRKNWQWGFRRMGQVWWLDAGPVEVAWFGWRRW